MKQIMKKLVPFMLAFVLLASCGSFAKAETAYDAAGAIVKTRYAVLDGSGNETIVLTESSC